MIQTVCKKHKWTKVKMITTSQQQVNWVQCMYCGLIKEKKPKHQPLKQAAEIALQYAAERERETAVAFQVFCEFEGYRIKGMDDATRNNVYNKFDNERKQNK